MDRIVFHWRALLAGLLMAGPLGAEDPPAAPRVTALTPLVVSPGFAGTIRLRGSKLKDATGITATGTPVPTRLEIKEKKEAAAPPGLDAAQAGDSEVVVELALAPEFPVGPLSLTVAVGGSATAPVVLRVRAAAALCPEKEPNNGFRGAMKFEPGQLITGVINGPRDVDVFEISGSAGCKFRATVTASGAASLLDPQLTAYDAAGNWLAGQDDTGESRDAALELSPASDGPIFLVLQDAFDGGSDGHSYFLELCLVP